MEVYTCILTAITGFCMFIADFASDIKENLRQFNETLNSIKDNKITIDDRVILVKKLNEIIEFYSEARELSVVRFDF